MIRPTNGVIVKLEPCALWLIGENSRVDLKHDDRRYFIGDMAESSRPSSWGAVRSEDVVAEKR